MNNSIHKMLIAVIAVIFALSVQITVGAIDIGDSLNWDSVLELIDQATFSNSDNTTELTTKYNNTASNMTGNVNVGEKINWDSVLDLIGQLKPSKPDNTTTTELTTKYNNMTSYMMGDVNFDGVITAEDARITLRASAQLITLNEIERFVTDVNCDKKVTANDARCILRYSAGLEKNF